MFYHVRVLNIFCKIVIVVTNSNLVFLHNVHLKGDEREVVEENIAFVEQDGNTPNIEESTGALCLHIHVFAYRYLSCYIKIYILCIGNLAGAFKPSNTCQKETELFSNCVKVDMY
jgi:hypothetical protein